MVRINFATVLGFAVLAMAASEELYSDKYDHIDPQPILENDSLRNEYYKCFMGTGPCVSEDAVFFAGMFTEAVVTKCRKCTEKQKKNFDVIVAWYTDNRPDEWEELMVKTLDEAKKKNLST